ncbi:MAG: SDR family oxidoreductase [Clostridia bacterium]|nr:SDR family oxidoreductase [Clostridia bacterium]
MNNKSAIVTGGAGGIGRGCCIALAKEGVKVMVADINLDAAKKTCDEIVKNGGAAIPVALDITQISSIEETVNMCCSQYGKIDFLINCAGICQEKKIEELTERDWDLVMAVNLKGTFFMSQQVLKHMKQNQYGKIVSIGSLAGEVGGVSTGVNYAASKAGIICLTKSFAKDAAGFNINVNCVSPGIIVTEMTKNLRNDPSRKVDTIPLKRYGTVEEVCDVILFLCSDKSSYITGANIDINGGVHM